MSDQKGSKRPRFDNSSMSRASPLANSIDALPDVVLQHCFSFIGPGHYRYIAGTCHYFEEIYSIEHANKTMWKNAAASVPCAKLCLEDVRELGRDVYASLFTLSLEAAKEGNVNVLEWARVNGYEAGPRHFQQAASFGHICVFEWAGAKHVDGWKSNQTFICAIDHSRIDILEWLLERRLVPWRAVDFATEHGKLQVLRWMKKRNLISSRVPKDVWYQTAYSGHIDVLEFLLENGFTPHASVMAGGMDSYRRHVLEFARDHNVGWNEQACTHAASAGNLRVLQWLRENNCPWNATVIFQARRQGHTDIVEWAINNGCPTGL